MAKIFWRNGWAWARAQHENEDVREPLGTQDKREAKARFDVWLAELKRPKLADGKATFSAAVDRFMDTHLPTLKRKSQDRYLLSLLTMRPYFEGLTLGQITKGKLSEFVAGRRLDGVTGSTIRRDLACLSSVFTIAEDFELCEGNPVKTFMRSQKKRGLVEAPPRTRYLGHEEERTILERAYREYDQARAGGQRREKQRTGGGRALQKQMILAAIILAIDTGLRDEELLGLQWPQVDLERNEVTVLAEHAKNNKQRQVPLHERARRVLEGLPRHHLRSAVLWYATGKRFADLNKTLQRIANSVGVTGIRWHDLRRTCGCRLLQDYSFPIEKVSKWLGHSSVAQTQKAYAFLDVRHLHQELAKSRTNAGTPQLEGPVFTGYIEGKQL